MAPRCFRVAGTLIDLNDDALLELEDCRTLELILLPAGRATGLGLHLSRSHNELVSTRLLVTPGRWRTAPAECGLVFGRVQLGAYVFLP